MIYVGVDVGKSGGYAVVSSEQTKVTKSGKLAFTQVKAETYPWDNEGFCKFISDLIYYDGAENIRACVERVNAMPGQGVTSMFNFGKSAGFIEGVLQGNKISYQLVPPQTWKKEFSLSSDKSLSIECCKQLFPGVSLIATDRSRKPSDGMAEALLMAEYARRKL